MDCSLPGSSIHGVFQARVLEWGAIAFSIATTRTMLFSIPQMDSNLKNSSIAKGASTEMKF